MAAYYHACPHDEVGRQDGRPAKYLLRTKCRKKKEKWDDTRQPDQKRLQNRDCSLVRRSWLPVMPFTSQKIKIASLPKVVSRHRGLGSKRVCEEKTLMQWISIINMGPARCGCESRALATIQLKERADAYCGPVSLLMQVLCYQSRSRCRGRLAMCNSVALLAMMPAQRKAWQRRRRQDKEGHGKCGSPRKCMTRLLVMMTFLTELIHHPIREGSEFRRSWRIWSRSHGRVRCWGAACSRMNRPRCEPGRGCTG